MAFLIVFTPLPSIFVHIVYLFGMVRQGCAAQKKTRLWGGSVGGLTPKSVVVVSAVGDEQFW